MQTELRELQRLQTMRTTLPSTDQLPAVRTGALEVTGEARGEGGKDRKRGVFSRHRVIGIVVAHVGVLAVVVATLFVSGLGSQMIGAFAQSHCAGGDQVYTVVSGDTLSKIAGRYHTTWRALASYNHIANPNMIYVRQTVCIPGHTVVQQYGQPPARGRGNFFPPGQCTWYAAQRYYQLTHIYVPWTTQSNAWQWTARAYQFRWHVSSRPSVGAIIDLQPWVEGAYGLGHVAVVEQVLSNGHVIASNLNWGVYYWRVVDVEFSPGPGVTFITF